MYIYIYIYICIFIYIYMYIYPAEGNFLKSFGFSRVGAASKFIIFI